MPRFTGPIIRRDTSLGVHVRALAECLMTLIADEANGVPSERRVRLRTHLALLIRAYPEHLAISETDLAQAIAEADGEEILDAP